jgi:hypothetical protein
MGTHDGETQEATIFFCWPDCWLVVNTHPEGPATGHFDAGFLCFRLSWSKCWDGCQVPSCYCMLLIQHSRFKLIKITPLLWRPLNYLTFQIIISTYINQKIKITLSLKLLLLTTLTLFTLILSLSEGRAGIAWEPCNNKMLSLPPDVKCLSLLPHSFLFDLLFYYPS